MSARGPRVTLDAGRRALMTLPEFVRTLKAGVPVGSTLNNPGGGTSTIIKYSQSFITYRRGKSAIRVSYEALFKAYAAHKGRTVSSSDLKQFAPAVFDSAARPAGHSCNATLLFIVLRKLDLASDVSGRGVRGDPYHVFIH